MAFNIKTRPALQYCVSVLVVEGIQETLIKSKLKINTSKSNQIEPDLNLTRMRNLLRSYLNHDLGKIFNKNLS